jgi:tetratricopeptide (TPR) repeat protein
MLSGPPSHVPFLAGLLCILSLLFSELSVSAQRPGGTSGGRPMGGTSGVGDLAKVTLEVGVREPNGTPITGHATVNLTSASGSLRLSAATRDRAMATFADVEAGDYSMEVSAPGYKTATETASVYGGGASTYTLYIYLHTEGEAPGASAAPRAPIMAPHLRKEVDKGLEKFRQHQYDAARTHFEKAEKMAPGNPDVQFLLGMLAYAEERLDIARVKFQAVLALYPIHERALLMLGELQLRMRDPAGAVKTLEKAYQVNGADWRTHLLLATAYFSLKDNEKARAHAVRSAALAKENAVRAQLLLGRILASDGKPEEARRTFEAVLRDFPNDPTAQAAKKQLVELDSPAATTASETTSLAAPATEAASPATPAVVRPWAPPDVDSMEYPSAEDVSCAGSDLILRTQARTSRQLENFERFTATEHIEHQEVDASGIPGPVRARDFNYLVFIQHPTPETSVLDEQRNGGENLEFFPTSLATRGLVGLGAILFDPAYEGDFVYKCEGLGAWRGQAAWKMHFEQRKELESRIRTWRNKQGFYHIALKGRVWIAAGSYDVLHIETDLREPVEDLQLSRDHLLIDYGPVSFNNGKTSLWLPWYAEMYMELRGKRYHHRHTLANYMLFSVDTTNSIASPKEIPERN